MEKLLLSPLEAAAHLSIGRSKVYELMRLGQLRSMKIGASRRIPHAALADYIAVEGDRVRADLLFGLCMRTWCGGARGTLSA